MNSTVDHTDTGADVKATMAALITRCRALDAENARLTKELARARESSTYRQRPPVMSGRTVQINAGCGPLYITLNEDERGRPFEVFFKLGKSGSCQQSYLEALGVAISVGLRYGADPQKFIEKFAGMRCPNPHMRTSTAPATLSCADGVSQGLAKALELALPGTEPPARAEATLSLTAEPAAGLPITFDLIADANSPQMTRTVMATGVGMCPNCNSNLVRISGCEQCTNPDCGYTGKCN